MVGGHDLGQVFAILSAGLIAVGHGAGIPGIGSDVIERNTFAVFVEISEAGLRAGKILLSGEADESSGFVVIARNDNSIKIKIGEIALRFGKARISG